MAIRPVHGFSLSALLLAVSGCVVPMGPEWSDPQTNAPPTISLANPPVGSVLDFGATGNASLGLEVGLSDSNTQDSFHVRWIIDYPPFIESVSHVALPLTLPGGSQVERPHLWFAPNCSDDALSRDFSEHRLLLAASDRPFSDDPQTLDGVTNGFLVEGSWIFTLDCP